MVYTKTIIHLNTKTIIHLSVSESGPVNIHHYSPPLGWIINTMVKDSYYREMMIICNFKDEILFKPKHLKSRCSVLPIGTCTQEIVTNTDLSAIKPLS